MKKKRCLVNYRFKDSMGYVFYRPFNTDHEARLWFERNKYEYLLKEFGRVGITYKSRFLDFKDTY